MIRNVLKVTNKKLREISESVTEFNDSLRSLCLDMEETMINENGYGLSAIQIGVPLRIVCMNDKNPFIYINPIIVSSSEDFASIEEGCLSIPKIFMKVKRHKEILLKYQDLSGQEKEEVLSGIDAICMQHEIDHLNGILMIDYEII